MNSGKYNRTGLFLITVFCVILIIGIIYLILKTPAQELRITASTTAEEFDISGTVDIYYFKALGAGETHTAVIRFMAVKNSSNKLFTSFGTGQYVYLGCSEMQTECDFISFGRFLRIKLTLNAAQTDLKLEDGTPFDITRYSLKPVLTIEE